MKIQIKSRTQVTQELAAVGYTPRPVGNGFSTKFYDNADGKTMIVDCTLAGATAQRSIGTPWTWYYKQAA